MQKERSFISDKKAQLTIFIIIAIVIVAGVGIYLVASGSLVRDSVPADFKPVYNYFLDCVREQGEIGKEILGEKGGYIDSPEFVPGSNYRPFSSQLDFFSVGIPYWYYLAGNNIVKEQVPSKKDMENQLDSYIETNLNCDFSEFELQGFDVEVGEPKINSLINSESIDLGINMELKISRGEGEWIGNSHDVEIESKLGRFYDKAREIYDYEKKNAFIENYAVDVLRLYAPVDGVEITCSPKIWMKNQIDEELKEALEANMQAIKLKGSYYKNSDKYFIQNLDSEDSVRFLYDSDWPTRIETWNTNNGVMIANPVGNQAGLGILGFCYVPYHFVYDINYPVLVQIFDERELFQFPFAVIIDKNRPREALGGESVNDGESPICQYQNTEMEIYSYNINLEPVESDISYECLGEECDIGRTQIEENDAVLREKFPQCINGFINAKAEGYARKRVQFSTNVEGTANILLDKIYNLSLILKIDSAETRDFAIINFVSEENSYSAVWPDQKSIQLSEGMYNISVYSYRNSSIMLPAINKEQCSVVPKTGISGILGLTEEKCFNINIPSQKISNAISGGGKSSEYITQEQLERGEIEINVNGIAIPKSVEEIQDNYNIVEVNPVYLNF